MQPHYTIGFNQEEKQELLEIFSNHPKWTARINNSHSFLCSELKNYTLIDNGNLPSGVNFYIPQPYLPTIPSYAKPLPEKLDIGKKVKIKDSHYTWPGRKGIVEQHYINADHCGDWGAHTYYIKGDDGECYTTRVENCELLD